MSQRILKKIQKYSKRDFEALLSLYNYRCLSLDQLYNLHYKKSVNGTKDVTNEYLKKKIVQFKKDNLIEETIHIDNSIPTMYSLTSDGISSVKIYFQFQKNIYNEDNKKIKRGYLTYSELKIAYRFMPHQYNLNLFTLEAKELFEKYNMNQLYFDEKHIPDMASIRPDAISTFDKFDIYYEMDMGTETINQLIEKWDHYRQFFNSSKNDYTKKKIILFICNPQSNLDNRINLIKDSISKYFIDCIKENVELYIGTPKKLMAIIKTKIIHEYFGIKNPLHDDLRTALIKSNFQVANGEQVSQYFENNNFLYYIKTTKGNHDYIVDEFFGEPISAMNKVLFYNNINAEYKKNFNKIIPLVLVATSEDILLNNHKIFDVNTENVFFTTIKRLENMPFHEAIFKINNGNMYCLDNTYKNFIETQKL